MKTVTLFLMGACCLFPAFASANEARIASVTGAAVVKPADQERWYSAKTGSKLTTGQRIRTKARSRVKLELADGSRVEVYPNSQVDLNDLKAKSPAVSVALGRLKAWVSKNRSRSKFEVHTPVAVCSVRGTEFSVDVDKQGRTDIEVFEGLVGVRRTAGGEEIPVGAGEKLDVLRDRPLREEQKTEGFSDRSVRHEVSLDMSREAVQAAAAEEMRLAEYREGKTLVDINGARVRLEEYIMRPAADTFKLVVLNERESRFDYFYYKGTFNKDLPQDLSVALRDMGGKLGATAPEYYLTEYEKIYSNTADYVKDNASGGHLVKITYNNDGTFTLATETSATDPATITTTVNAADTTNGAYDPLSDTFDPTRTTALDLSVFNPATDRFETFSAGQTAWKTRFNTYDHIINGNEKQRFIPSVPGANILAADLDGHWVYPSLDSFGTTIYGEWGVSSAASSYPDGDALHQTMNITYRDNTFEQYDTYILSDEGKIARRSDFASILTGTAYKEELLKWNYEQVITATEFGGRKIDLVVEPKIFIKSGIIE